MKLHLVGHYSNEAENIFCFFLLITSFCPRIATYTIFCHFISPEEDPFVIMYTLHSFLVNKFITLVSSELYKVKRKLRKKTRSLLFFLKKKRFFAYRSFQHANKQLDCLAKLNELTCSFHESNSRRYLGPFMLSSFIRINEF